MNVRKRVASAGMAIWLTAGLSALGGRLEDGWSSYGAGRYQEAYDAFMELFRETPLREDVNFALGMAAFRLGKLSHARFAFERVLASNPGNHRARVELGRTSLAMGQYDIAREEFEAALAANPPERVQRNIRWFLSEIRRRERRWDVDLQAGLGVFYDDNVNYGPSSRTIDTVIGELEVATNSRPIEAWGLAVNGGLSGLYDPGRRGRWVVTAGAGGYRNWLDGAPEQEIAYARGQLGLRRVGEQTAVDLPVRLDYLEFGDDPFVTIWGGDPSFAWAPAPSWQLVTRGVVEYRNYDQGRDRDGPCYRGSQTLRKFFGARRHELSATAAYYYEDTDDAGFANYGPDFTLTTELRPWRWLSLYGLLQYRIADYEEIMLEGLQEDDRHDEQFQAVGGVRWQVVRGLALDFNYRYVNNDSNFGLYEYDRNIFMLNTSATF